MPKTVLAVMRALGMVSLMGQVLPAQAAGLLEPHMAIAGMGTAQNPVVAVTLDACTGQTDWRILQTLVDEKIPATIFATARWMRGNAKAVATLKKHPELFEIEDHGAEHVPAVIGTKRPYGLKPAGTVSAVQAEIDGGATAISRAFGRRPVWYRDATALYSTDALGVIRAKGYRVAGFSLNGDFGATASARTAKKNIAAARNGDVILSHVNQPGKAAGLGVVAGLRALKAKGFHFVLLREATPYLHDIP